MLASGASTELPMSKAQCARYVWILPSRRCSEIGRPCAVLPMSELLRGEGCLAAWQSRGYSIEAPDNCSTR